jgi:F-type H+-transporting ATPase subunit a
MADYTFANFIPGFAHHEHEGWHELFGYALPHPVINPAGHVTMTHVVFGMLSFALIIGFALIARRKYSNRDEALIPEPRLSVRNFFELIFDAVFDMMEGLLGEKLAKRYFPLIAALALFIFVSNIMGLVPGFAPSTSNLNTTIGPALVVFVVYNFAGIAEHGLVAHVKHLMGPVLLLAPLLFVIEVISHLARPVSLGIRLTGNMTGDHMVLGVFGGIAEMVMGVPLLFPIPFLFLGLLVCIIQTLVFCLLSTVYLALATAHDEH